MILIDEPRPVSFRRFKLGAHMISTYGGEMGTNELLRFGRRIGQRPSWLQKRGQPDEHFDVFDGRIEAAVQAGAMKVTSRELVEHIRAKRRARAST